MSKKMAICDLFFSWYHLNNIYAYQLLPIFFTRYCRGFFYIIINNLGKLAVEKRSEK